MKALLTAALIALPSLALAHPHDTDAPKKETVEIEKEKTSVWPFFGKSEDGDSWDREDDATSSKTETQSRTIIRLKKDGEDGEMERVFTWDSDEMENAARDFTAMLADSDLASEMTDALEELKGSLKIDTDSDGATAFFFDGEEMLRFKRDQEIDNDDRLSISGLGRNLTVERKTTKKDGKTRTRIVIEMDGGEELDIDLPERDAE